MKTTALTAEGITCGGCANAIKKAVSGVPGVVNVDVEVATKRVTVTHGDNVASRDVEDAIRKAGFQPA